VCHDVAVLPDEAVVVVGGSLAGLRSAQALRREGHTGPVTIVSEERHWPPYDRPPLSKQVLVGSLEPERARLRVPDDLGAEVRTGRRAVGVDLAERSVLLDDGDRLSYGGLVVATGATPRRIPGTDLLAGVHVLRTIDDAVALRSDLDGAAKVVVVGAGFIGCEVASSCRTLGLEVTIVDLLPLPLAPLGSRAGEVVRTLHEDHGVQLRLGTGVAAIEGGPSVTGVRLADGTLAGSTLTMDQALRNLVQLGLELSDASRRVSTYAADYLGLNERGRLQPGAHADLVVLDRDLQLQRVIVEGEEIDLAHAD